MLLLDSKTRQIDGITVFPDHADRMQYYYLPLAPHLTTIPDLGAGHVEVPQFSLIRFRGRAGSGGILNFDVNLGASPDQIEDIRRVLQQEEGLDDLPRVAPVTTPSGAVRLLMLGRQTGDAGPAGDGSPKFVLSIDHHATPALYGNNQAAFSVKLDAPGVTVIERSLQGEILPIAVVYSLSYVGLRPAYSIRLDIDWDRVQTHLEEKFSAGFIFSSVEIGHAVDELVDERAIVLEADTFLTEDEENAGVIDRRDLALAQVRSMITEAFFQPSLPPYEPGKESEWEDTLRKVAGVAGMIALGPAATVASSAYFSYSKIDYRRVDRKILNVNFSERVAVQRSIHPQGHLAGLFRLLRDTALPLDRFVIDANLDNPWFERRRLNVSALADFAADGIASINVQARYGDEPRNVLLTGNSPSGTFDWTSLMDGDVMRRPVTLQFEVNFDGVDTTERPRKLTSPVFECEVENCEIVPRELYAISPVPIIAERFPWDIYPLVEVQVRYQDEANGLDERDVFRLTEAQPTVEWRMFVLEAARREFSSRVIFRAADHRDVDTGWRTNEDEQITIRDPFPRKRVLDVVPNMDWSQLDRCFVDLRYEDGLNGLLEEASFEFTEGSPSAKISVSMVDPEHKQVFFKVTFLFKDGRMIEVPESMTLDRRIVVRPEMRGRRVVEVRPPADFLARRLKRATAEVRYEDFMAGLSFNDNFAFDGAAARAYFEFDYVDEARDRYEVRVTYLFDNGLERSTEWEAFEAPVLHIKAP